MNRRKAILGMFTGVAAVTVAPFLPKPKPKPELAYTRMEHRFGHPPKVTKVYRDNAKLRRKDWIDFDEAVLKAAKQKLSNWKTMRCSMK